MKENSVEEDIKIALDKFSDNKDIDSAILIVEKFILGNYILKGGRTNIVKDSLRYILSDYKRVLKENEELREKIFQNNCDKVISKFNKKLNELDNDYIPKQKIKEKIEELDIEISTCEYADDDSEEYKQEVEKNKAELLMARKVLQQLLEMEE